MAHPARVALALVVAAPFAAAQTADRPAPPPAAHEHAGMHQHATSPYAHMVGDEVKALSSDEMKALKEGTGMGLAKPAEFNHYPGPRHVLDMKEEIGLTEKQTDELEAIYERMHSAAVVLGGQIIAKEKALDTEFASGTIDKSTLADLTSRIGALQAALRAVHLSAHLETKSVLTPEQVARYDALRGYAPAPRP
jgi:Spy/CpxP family protein refolding chaperone